MKKINLLLIFLTHTTLMFTQVLDDIICREIVQEKPVLAYPELNENDVSWQKEIWRVIDVREKINQPFLNKEQSFFEVLTYAARSGEIPIYSIEKDDFSQQLPMDSINDIFSVLDTIIDYSGCFYSGNNHAAVVRNEINYEDVKRYRLKEIWYFDNQTTTVKVRILGIAPLIDIHDDHGNFVYEKPLFWIHYPSSRQVLARATVFNSGNDSSRMTWENLFEMRKFSSYIYKESNIGNTRLSNQFAGVELLLNAQKINQTIFNYEQDLWSK